MALMDSITNANSDSKAHLKSKPKKIKSKASTKKLHLVKQGQTLSQIAKIHGITVSQLKHLNNIKNAKIRKGQKLIIRK